VLEAEFKYYKAVLEAGSVKQSSVSGWISVQ